MPGRGITAAKLHKYDWEHQGLRQKSQEPIDKLNSQPDRLVDAASDLAKRADSLLPGATSARLAHVFMERSEPYLWPKRIWAWTLAPLALFALNAFAQAPVADDADLHVRVLDVGHGNAVVARIPATGESGQPDHHYLVYDTGAMGGLGGASSPQPMHATRGA